MLRRTLAVLVVVTVTGCGGGGGDSVAPASTGAATISSEQLKSAQVAWAPGTLDVSATPGAPRSVTVQLTTAKALAKPFAILATDDLKKVVHVTPAVIGPLAAGSKTTITLSLDVPVTAPLGKVLDGTLRLRRADGEDESDSRPQQLRVKVTTAPFSDVIFYSELGNPLLLGFTLPSGSVATLYGDKGSSGTLAQGKGMFFTGADNSLRRIEQDPQGRPISASLPGFGKVTFAWQDNSNFTVTAVLANGKRYTVPVTLSAPLPISAGTTAVPSTSIRGPRIEALATSALESKSLVNSTLTVSVHSNVPETGADVWATIVPANIPGTTGYHLPLAEGPPATYQTGFVNFESAIPSGSISNACTSIVGGYATTCAVLAPVSAAMVSGGCSLLTAAVALDLGPLAYPILGVCQSVFADAAAACQAVTFAPAGQLMCRVIESTVSYFDPDGVNITVKATKDTRSGSASAAVASAVVDVQMSVTLPPSVTVTANENAQNLAVGLAMAAFKPLTVSGGDPQAAYSYSIAAGSAPLPSGLSLDTTTGMVSGTPSAPYPTANVVFQVQDSRGAVLAPTSTVSFTVTARTYAFSLVTVDHRCVPYLDGTTCYDTQALFCAGSGCTRSLQVSFSYTETVTQFNCPDSANNYTSTYTNQGQASLQNVGGAYVLEASPIIIDAYWEDLHAYCSHYDVFNGSYTVTDPNSSEPPLTLSGSPVKPTP